MRVGLEMVNGLLPVGRKNVLVLPVQTLVNVRPRSRIELCRRIPLLRELRFNLSVSVQDGSFATESREVAEPNKPLSSLLLHGHTVSIWMVA